MAKSILAGKLRELDREIASIQRRIHLAEAGPSSAARREYRLLTRKYAAQKSQTAKLLRSSQAAATHSLLDAYQGIEQILTGLLQDLGPRRGGADAESKLLLAEYALDFASQAANRAVLLSLEAIDTYKAHQTSRERNHI